MSDTLSIKIITPERVVVDADNVNSIETTGVEGEFQVYPEHTPFLTSLTTGHVFYHSDGEFHYVCISGGFFEIKDDKVVILVRTAEKADEIDKQRAEDSKKRAEKRLASDKSDIDRGRAAFSLRRAENRLRIARTMEGL
jgi:F-type H+-transporting ATPase subunit epsilon